MKKILITLVVIIILAIAWWLISPLFIDKTVNEELDIVLGDLVLTHEEMEDMSEEEMKEAELMFMAEAAKLPDTVMDEPAVEMTMDPAVSPMVRRGTFIGADDGIHDAAGSAFLIETEDQRVLRLEDLDVTNGPDLRVYLSSETTPTRREGLGDFIELDKLKGNIGNQNYEIPDDVDLSQYQSVVIYCKPFHVVFGHAVLQ